MSLPNSERRENPSGFLPVPADKAYSNARCQRKTTLLRMSGGVQQQREIVVKRRRRVCLNAVHRAYLFLVLFFFFLSFAVYMQRCTWRTSTYMAGNSGPRGVIGQGVAFWPKIPDRGRSNRRLGDVGMSGGAGVDATVHARSLANNAAKSLLPLL